MKNVLKKYKSPTLKWELYALCSIQYLFICLFICLFVYLYYLILYRLVFSIYEYTLRIYLEGRDFCAAVKSNIPQSNDS